MHHNREIINRLRQKGLPQKFLNELENLQAALEKDVQDNTRYLYLRATYVMKRAA